MINFECNTLILNSSTNCEKVVWSKEKQLRTIFKVLKYLIS